MGVESRQAYIVFKEVRRIVFPLSLSAIMYVCTTMGSSEVFHGARPMAISEGSSYAMESYLQSPGRKERKTQTPFLIPKKKKTSGHPINV